MHCKMETGTAVLVQRRSPEEPDLMDEFEALAETAGYTVIGKFDVVGPPSARFGIRTGKVEEIGTWIEHRQPDFVLFAPALRSGQMFRLMEEWGVEVRDRTQLILEIFDRHARTPQAKLQIEQARLSYELPFQRHQIRMRLQREHTGDRPTTEQVGAGEDLLNMRVREIRRRIAHIRRRLTEIWRAQDLKRKQRDQRGFYEVALAGYTNAGKSTLHRALTGSEVEVADGLFTTLSTKASLLGTPGRRTVLIDSVGFISSLPRDLLDAFRTTLQEIADADVIVLVVDGSDSTDEIMRKTATCTSTFLEIGANGIPVVVAMNKVDLLTEAEVEERLDVLRSTYESVVPVSAMHGINLQTLVAEVEKRLPPLEHYQLSLEYGDESASLISWLHEVGRIEHKEYSAHGVRLDVALTADIAAKLSRIVPPDRIRRRGH